MPYHITLDALPAGYALDSARGGGSVRVAIIEFTSSEDGDLFISRLEGGPADIISKLPKEARVIPSMIDHLLAIIRRDRTATIYVNELPFIAEIRTKRVSIEKGQIITEDDVADIQALRPQNVEIPADAGIIFAFSYGWRKGLFFDLQPLVDLDSSRKYDISRVWASFYSYLFQQNLFKIKQLEWESLFKQQWFPFISLRRNTVRRMINHVRNGWEIDELLPDIHNEILDNVDERICRWKHSSMFAPHIELLKHAIDRFKDGDYVSAAAIIYPRIEGIMRTLHAAVSTEPASQRKLVNSVVNARRDTIHERSLILPNMFSRFLTEVYFAGFDSNNPTVMSRHSVAHGVAPAKDFSLKSTMLGILITDQISFFLP